MARGGEKNVKAKMKIVKAFEVNREDVFEKYPEQFVRFICFL